MKIIKYKTLKYSMLVVFVCALCLPIMSANSADRIMRVTYQKSQIEVAKIDTCVLSGMNFKIIDHRSGRNLHAIIQNNDIKIVSNKVQNFKYRIIHYVFSSNNNEQMPVIRVFAGDVDYRVLRILEHSKPGERYTFEDIIVVDKSGERLKNEVRSILIERI